MKQPRIALALMITFTVAVAGVGVALSAGLSKAFFANSALNSVILAILVFGISVAFIQIGRLQSSIAWLSDFRAKRESRAALPAVLAPLTPALGKPGELHQLRLAQCGRCLTAATVASMRDGKPLATL